MARIFTYSTHIGKPTHLKLSNNLVAVAVHLGKYLEREPMLGVATLPWKVIMQYYFHFILFVKVVTSHLAVSRREIDFTS